MKKIILAIACLFNAYGMHSDPSLDLNSLEVKLRFSPFERAVIAIKQRHEISFYDILAKNPNLRTYKSPLFSGADLFSIAMVFGAREIAKSLITHGNFRDSLPRVSAMQVAAELGDEELANLLLHESTQNPETNDGNGVSPLSVSRNKSNKSVFTVFMRHLEGYMADDEHNAE